MSNLSHRIARSVGALTALATALSSIGCVECAARLIVTAPNHGKKIDDFPVSNTARLAMLGVTSAFRVEIEHPKASLAVWVIDPGAWGPGQPASEAARGPFDCATPAPTISDVPRGTILFLHGIGADKEMLLGTASDFAALGFRCVLVDSRGHGESTGDWLGFGAIESGDYSRVLDELERRRLLTEKVGLYGVSYGGGVAVQFACRDTRVSAVVAVCPFTSMREVVHDRARRLGLHILMSQEMIDGAITRGCELAGIRVEDADAVSAMMDRRVPLLIIHGRQDHTIPIDRVKLLCATADGRLVVIDDATHYVWTREGRRHLARDPYYFLSQRLAVGIGVAR